ncbi:hypothetical protein [Streptomyces sp. NPDC085596]|uniref:hypothetical protein n=1 Tax=Streptomyces sp. NPDC085596 TaxID=3365731 RepID=UPI0037D1A82D
MIGEEEDLLPEPDADPDSELTFTEQPLDATCRYGEQAHVYNDRRPRRDLSDARGLHTFPEVPERLFRIPTQPQRLTVTQAEREAAAQEFGCPIWQIGPCARCGKPIHRHGPRAAHACPDCRRRAR